MKPRRFHHVGMIVAAVAAIAGSMVAGASSANLETLWDEAVDLEVARGLREAPLDGSQPAIDPSQLRLPMYVNAIWFWLTGSDDLETARGVSLFFGIITVIATAALARFLFDGVIGMLAACLLAFSPYFLSFSRIAMTEGDVFVACFTTVAMLTFLQFLKRPAGWRWLLAGLMLALALGSKLFAAFLLPVFWLLTATTVSEPAVQLAAPKWSPKWLHRLLGAQMAIVVLAGGCAVLHRYPPGPPAPGWTESVAGTVSVTGWVLLLLLWLATIAYVAASGVMSSGRNARTFSLVVFSVSTFFVLMPAHLLDPAIGREIVLRTINWDDKLPLAIWKDHLRLYAGILLLKATIPVGVAAALGVLWAAIRERTAGRWRPCAFSFVFYVTLMCFLPLKQTFYLMAVFPLLMVTAAAVLVGSWRWLREVGPGQSAFATLLLIGVLGFFTREVVRGYPWYHLYGVDWVGRQWLGEEARGYRNLIQTPSDGVESLVRWCNTDPRVKPGDRVVSYLWEHRIVTSALPEKPHYEFEGRGVTPSSEVVPAPPELLGADFVLLHVNNFLGYGDRPPDHPDRAFLKSEFEPVHTVRRGNMEVAWVFARIPLSEDRLSRSDSINPSGGG